MFYKNRNTPRSLILAIDTLIVFFSVFTAYLLRFNFNIPSSELDLLPQAILVILTIRLISFLLSKIFAGIIRYTEIQDVIRVIAVVFFGSVLITISSFVIFNLTDFYIIPRAVIIIEFITTSLSLIFFRLIVKITYNELQASNKSVRNIAIFGAGEAGVIAKRALSKEPGIDNKVIAFFDDSQSMVGKKIEGITIISGTLLSNYIEEHQIDTVVIAVQNISPKRKSQIAEICVEKGITVKDIPPISSWINGELSAKQIKNINITDLLERDEINLNLDQIQKSYQGKIILVTGAAGSIGSEIVRQLIHFKPAKLILFDQAETPLHNLELEFTATTKTPIEYVIGDIRDFNRLNKLFTIYKPQIVFHAAAYKHVPMMENNPAEAIMTNVLGTKNLADVSMKFSIETFIMISSDKAVNPTNVMGASKRIAEMYIQSLNNKNEKLKFITTRFGNVLGSNGSVIPLFKKQIEERQPITITHPEITRYFMTIPEASQLVLEAGATGKKNEIYVFDMGKSVKIYDLARKMIKLYGLELGKDIQIIFTGLRPGEKLYEELLSNQENTLPTENKKILKAKVREIDSNGTQSKIENLITLAQGNDNNLIVSKMKEIVSEFKSKNSVYESLD
jgi:FlaA1/EpsC-like NDP-sugar epimerase